MKRQLVLQWSAGFANDYDDLLDMEDRLEAGLAKTDADVDGHDLGSGEMNIFIHTHQPRETFITASACLGAHLRLSQVRAAYCPLDGDNYTILWPRSLREFYIS